MNRLDGQGHHPWIRPHNFHTKKARAKLKVIRNLTPKAWQIAMMKLGIGFVPTEGNCIVLGKLIEWDFLISSETTQEEPICVDMSCGEVGDYAMLDAAPSRPPPKHGWTYKVIRHTAVLFLAALMALATACKKDPTPEPQPTPNQPTDTVTPIVPEPTYPDTIYVPFEWRLTKPNIDTIKFYSDKNDVKIILMDMAPIPYEQQLAMTSCPWQVYQAETDSLYKRYDIAPHKVRARGDLYVNNFLSESTQWWPGIMPIDSARLAHLGIVLHEFHLQKK